MVRYLVCLILFSTNVGAIPAEGHQIMIAGPSPFAIEAGRRIAREGGNVVDVAVAVGLVLSVTSPYYASLGGGGFALVKMDGPVAALDFRETAPAATGKEFFKDLPTKASIVGGKAVAVPGVAAGLLALHQKFGKMKWERLFAPALELAEKGFPVSGEWVHITRAVQARFNAAGKAAFSAALRPGDVSRQPKLAQALRLLRDKKLDGFYSGPVAEDLVASVKQSDGVLTLPDLKNYKVRWLTPLTLDYAGSKLYLMPPPSSGGVIVETALKLMQQAHLSQYEFLSLDELHVLGEIEARAFRGRSELGDPDFHKNPIETLTSDQYIKDLASSIHLKTTTPLPPFTESKEKQETTHFSIMDAQGHAVALTVTQNGGYGSALVSDRFHIALNNEMDDFDTHPNQPNMYGLTQGMGNSVEPGKRPLSSMTPTLVETNGKITLSLGAPGGPRIISAVLQALYRIVAQGLDIDLAIQAPRLHQQFSPEKLYVDSARLSPEILQGLRARGHVVETATKMAKVYVVRLRPDGILEGAFDARGEGAAGGI